MFYIQMINRQLDVLHPNYKHWKAARTVPESFIYKDDSI